MLMKLRNGDAVDPEAVLAVVALKKSGFNWGLDESTNTDKVNVYVQECHALSVPCQSFEDAQRYRDQLISEINERTGPKIEVSEWNRPSGGLLQGANGHFYGTGPIQKPTSDSIEASHNCSYSPGIGPASYADFTNALGPLPQLKPQISDDGNSMSFTAADASAMKVWLQGGGVMVENPTFGSPAIASTAPSPVGGASVPRPGSACAHPPGPAEYPTAKPELPRELQDSYDPSKPRGGMF